MTTSRETRHAKKFPIGQSVANCVAIAGALAACATRRQHIHGTPMVRGDRAESPDAEDRYEQYNEMSPSPTRASLFPFAAAAECRIPQLENTARRDVDMPVMGTAQ